MIQIPVEPQLTEYLHRKAARSRTPLSVSFELTPVCNMACRMCYVRMDRKTQESIGPLAPASQWLELAGQAREQGLLYVLLTGGEPFTHPEFRQILEGLHRMGFILTVNTNGTLIDESAVEWLKRTPPSRFNITLYGASDETYGRLCGKPDGFTRATRAIRLLREAGMTVKVNISLTPYNAGDLEAMVRWCRENGLIIQATSYMFPPLRRDGASTGRNEGRFTPEEAAYWSAKIESQLNGEEAFLKRVEEQDLAALSTEPEEFCLPEESGEGDCIRCRAGRCTAWVTWRGQMNLCGMIPPEKAVNAFETGYMAAWKAVVAQADAVRLPAACRECALRDTCRACAAMVYTETGGYEKVPEYRCRMAHAYAGQAARVAEEIRKARSENGV